MSLIKIVESESKKIDASGKDKAVFEFGNSRKTRRHDFFYFLWGIVEFFKLLGRKVENRMYYTVCMDEKEDSVYTFRVCNDRVKGILCYDKININEKLKRIKIKDKEYLICPYAKQVYNEIDYDRFRIDK